MSNFSVIIPSRTRSNLEACIMAIRAAGETCRAIAVDDGLDEWEFKQEFEPFSLCAGAKPFIFSRNMNIGVRMAGANDVILLNDDAVLQTPEGFGLLQREADEHPEYGIIGAVTNVTGQALQKPRGIGLREVPHIAFVCVLIPRRTIARVGLLDERYCLDYGCEDRDYCEAVRRAGLKVGVHDGCFVDHASLQSTFRGDPHASRSFARNWALFQQKWGLSAC